MIQYVQIIKAVSVDNLFRVRDHGFDHYFLDISLWAHWQF